MAKKKTKKPAEKKRGIGGKIRKGLGDVFGVKPRRKKAAAKKGEKFETSGLGHVRKKLGDVSGLTPKRTKKKKAEKRAKRQSAKGVQTIKGSSGQVKWRANTR